MTDLGTQTEPLSKGVQARKGEGEERRYKYQKVYPKLKRFKIGHLNIASLVKHKNELLVFLAKLPFDVICINETQLEACGSPFVLSRTGAQERTLQHL